MRFQFFTFQQDNAAIHLARETVELFSRSIHDFIAPSMFPPYHPHLYPSDYQAWGVMQQPLYQTRAGFTTCKLEIPSLKSGIVSHRLHWQSCDPL